MRTMVYEMWWRWCMRTMVYEMWWRWCMSPHVCLLSPWVCHGRSLSSPGTQSLTCIRSDLHKVWSVRARATNQEPWQGKHTPKFMTFRLAVSKVVSPAETGHYHCSSPLDCRQCTLTPWPTWQRQNLQTSLFRRFDVG